MKNLKPKMITKREQKRLELEAINRLKPCIEFTELRTYKGEVKPTIFCLEDNQNSLMTIDAFPRHYLAKRFNLTLQQYYDKHYKTPDEDICIICGNQTKFNGYEGYSKFCSKPCARKDPDYSDKIKESFKTRDKLSEQKKREETNLEKYGAKHQSQLDGWNEKRIDTCLKKFGKIKDFSDPSHQVVALQVIANKREFYNELLSSRWTSERIKEVQQIREQTFLDRYNVVNAMHVQEFRDSISFAWFDKTKEQQDNIKLLVRKSHEQTGRWLPIELKSEAEQYWQKVWLETRKHIKKLYENWNGYDTYTNDKLVENEEYLKIYPTRHVNTNIFQPCIDHKISIKYGFVNGLSIEEIGSIKNLCIVGKATNSSKSSMNVDDYLRFING